MKLNIISRHGLLDSIPYGLSNNEKVVQEVEKSYFIELSTIIDQAQIEEKGGQDITASFNKFDGPTAFFEIKGNNLPIDQTYNWHGQNTSQWLYAGCIQVTEDGHVSRHH